MDEVIKFIKDHQNEDLVIYYTAVPELEGIKITMRRNTAIVTRIVTYWEIASMLPNRIRCFLNEMYSQFSGLKEAK